MIVQKSFISGTEMHAQKEPFFGRQIPEGASSPLYFMVYPKRVFVARKSVRRHVTHNLQTLEGLEFD